MTHRPAAEDYQEFVRRAQADDNVVGLILVGPHAANAYVTPDSDHDAYVVLRREDASWATPHGSPVEVWPKARAAGLSEVVEGWEPDLGWLRGG